MDTNEARVAAFATKYTLQKEYLTGHVIYEIESGGADFDGYVSAVRIVDGPVRFGNAVYQILFSTLVARYLGCGTVGLRRFALRPVNLPIETGWVTYCRGEDMAKTPTLAGPFFNTYSFGSLLQAVPAESALQAIEVCLKPLFNQLLSGAENLDDDVLVLHFRSGDIFHGEVRELDYVQPPASYYTKAIEWGQRHLGISRVRLVYEDRGNPAVAVTEAFLRDRSLPFESQSLTVEEDLRTLLGAKHLVAGVGSFCEAVALLSSKLQTLISFRNIELFQDHHWSAEPFLLGILRARGTKSVLVKDIGEGFIPPLTWINSPSQLQLICTFPSELLEFADGADSEYDANHLKSSFTRSIDEIDYLRRVIDLMLDPRRPGAAGGSLAEQRHIRLLQFHLRRLDGVVAQKDAQIAEYLYHLDRMNNSAGWRLVSQLDKFVLALAALFAGLIPKFRSEIKSARPLPVTLEASLPPSQNNRPSVSIITSDGANSEYNSSHLKSSLARSIEEIGNLRHVIDAMTDRCRPGAASDSLAEQRQIRALQFHLRRLDGVIAEKNEEITEYLYHLDRMNKSAWWRLVSLLNKLLRAPAALLAGLLPKPRGPAEPTRSLPVPVAPEAILLPSRNHQPEVSIVILSYGEVDYTLRCLHSIAQHPPLCTIEVIVSDDRSEQPDLERLTSVANLTFIQPPANLGFLRHANWAVTQSKGKFILLLNNDTELQQGTIDALVETACTTANVGLVGSKLVYPDGRLQEAGGIVWDDGSAWNYGHLGDPGRPEFNYVRDADYISAASILVPRDVWDRLGGFDESFAPAYCEDSDLAFRLRQKGLRVLYQPELVVVHYEGVSHGTDVKAGVKAYQVVNQERLRQRWFSTLQVEQYPNGQHIVRARDRAKNKRIMLMIDHYVPEPDRDAGSRTMIDIIKSLQIEGWIVKFWPQNLHYDPIYTSIIQQLGVETAYEPWVRSFDQWISERKEDIDLVFVSRPSVAQICMESVRRIIPNAPIIFYGHDLHCARMRIEARVTNSVSLVRKADAMEAAERQIWRNADLVLYPSQDEVDEVRRMEPDVDAAVLPPFCFDQFRSLRSAPVSTAILFVGGFAHSPNVDAAIWFATEILPIVRRDAPLVRLWIVGTNPAPAVRSLASDTIEVTGYVTDYDLARRYGEARVAVVPLRIGAGVKLKVVEALHEGLPLVTTPIGAQGLPGLGGAAVVVEEPEVFAREILTLLRDDEAWEQQARRQLDYAQAHFSREASTAVINAATGAAKKNAERRKRF